jgi:hypothetical protein
MEYLLNPNLMLMLVTLVTMACEVVRFKSFLALGLDMPGRGGHRYTYYVDYSMSLPLVFPMMAITVTIVGTLLWRRLLALPAPWSFYIGLFFVLGMLCFFALLLYKALSKVMRLRTMVGTLLFLAVVETVCFIFQPLRFLFGGTFFFLITLAFGQTVRFTRWEDLVAWIEPSEDEGERRTASRGSVRVRIFLEAEGVLSRRGDRLEIQGEEIAEADGNPVAALARRLLDRTRLTEVVAAQERLHQRKDLLAEIPAIIAQNVGKLAARQEALSQGGGPPGQKEEKMQDAVREVLDQALGGRMLSLLYWNYALPQQEVNLCLTRAPQADLKPIVTFEEYLGMPLSWYERRQQAKKRR